MSSRKTNAVIHDPSKAKMTIEAAASSIGDQDAACVALIG